MSLQRKIAVRARRRALRVRSRLRASGLPRISVFRSLSHMYAQLIDDAAGKTLASSSTLELKSLSGNKTVRALAIGKDLASKALALGVTTAVFDRGNFMYHGRVKAVAEGLREGGLEI